MIPRATRFPLLDSLRAIGVLVVVLTHVSVTAGIDTGSALRPYFTNTTWTIAIFFLLSAFLLYRPYARFRIDGQRRPDLRAYGWGRFLRVVPAFWVALTIGSIWLGREQEVFSAEGIPIFYGFGQIYFDHYALGGLAVAWSLCVEVVFYALLPAWASLMLRVPGRTREMRVRTELIGVAVLVVLGLAYRIVLVSTDLHLHAAGVLALPAFLDWFAIGMGFGVLSVWLERRREDPAPLRVVDRHPGMFWLAGGVLFWFVSQNVGPLYGYPDPDSLDQVVEHVLLLAIAVALFLPAAFGNPERGWTRRMLGTPVVLYIGTVSYAIYLWHIPVLEQLKRWDLGSVGWVHPYVAWPVATIAITVAIATVSWYAIEKPALSLKGLARRRKPAPAQAATGAAAAETPPEPAPEATAEPAAKPVLGR